MILFLLHIVPFMFMLLILQLTCENSNKIFQTWFTMLMTAIEAESLCVFFNFDIHIVKIHTPEDQVGSSDD